jgi:hypothetical protein
MENSCYVPVSLRIPMQSMRSKILDSCYKRRAVHTCSPGLNGPYLFRGASSDSIFP